MSQIEVRVLEGQGWEPARVFTPGQPNTPFSVGAQSEWALSSPSTAPLHAYLYFDGTFLFVATAQPELPTLLNGAPIGTAWTPVELHSEILLGGVRLVVVEAGAPQHVASAMPSQPTPLPAGGPELMEDIATAFFQQPAPLNAGPPPVVPPSATKPLLKKPSLPVSAPDGDDSTRFLPIEQMRKAGPAGASGAYPAQGDASATGPNPALDTPLPGAGQAQQAPLFSGPNPFPVVPSGAMPGGGAPTILIKNGSKSALLDAWKSASPPRKALYVLMPIALLGAVIALFDEPQPATTPSKAAASASASAKSAGSAAASATAATSADAAAKPPEESSTATALGALLPAPVRSAYVPPPANVRAPEPEKSLERKATDAIAVGNYAEALRLYERLNQENPNVPAFQEALRILKNKVK